MRTKRRTIWRAYQIGTSASKASTLTVKTRESPTSALALKPGWKVIGVSAASVGDIKPGDFVGIASLPTAAGGAIEVLIFP